MIFSNKANIMDISDLLKPYDPTLNEPKILERWQKDGAFKPRGKGKPFAVVFPPANVTGVLHLGHALTIAIQDIIIRFRRMQGYDTLYIPGTDHAAIATQAKVEAELYKKEKKTRRDFSREDFLKMVEDYAANSQSAILSQLRTLGASCDWDHLAYTLDDKRSFTVRTAFSRLYKMGLIYRGTRLVNWDPKLQTNVSDEEIEWREEVTPFYYLRYGPFVIATARPETKFGDKYVVMHPKDERYAKYKHGQKIEVEWINGPITATIIKDDAVDMEFGTGVMTITPAHDAADYAIAERHSLDKDSVIDLQGKLLPIAGEFAGQHISKARQLIVAKLESKGLVEKIDEKYIHRVAVNSRGGGVIEPQIREQWFVCVNRPFTLEHSEIRGLEAGSKITLKQLLRHTVESGQVKIIPEHFAKTYFHWIDNLEDWCISRQIIFGHRIPVWYRDQEVYCEISAPSGDGWTQDPDTLDTWFSSALWTFSTLGWPEETPDFKKYHPNALLETGYDILFFWVARMILMSGALLGQLPFPVVYLHGIVRDPERQKMSKSKGNVIDPLDIIKKYGTDALRFALIYGNSAGTDMAFDEARVRGMKNFANKIWNIARFVLTNAPDEVSQKQSASETEADKAILASLETTIKLVTQNLEDFRFNEAAQGIYDFIWHELADKYLEASKNQLKDPSQAENTRYLLRYCLKACLRLLHPFMPFITESLAPLLGEKNLLVESAWPEK